MALRNFFVSRRSAWASVAMSTLALVFILIYVAMFGVQRQADEGTAARLFQFIMIGQLPIIIYFVLSNFAKYKRETLIILALQTLAWFSPVLLVIFLEL